MYEYIAPYITMLQPQRMFPVTYRDHEVSKTPVDLSNVKEADTYRKSEQENQTTAAENAKLEKYLLGIESGDSNNTFDPDDLEDLDERTMNYWDKAKVQGGNSRLSGTPDGFVGPATATFDYFSEDIFTMLDPNASMGEIMLASVFVLPTPAKFLKPLDDVASGLKKGGNSSKFEVPNVNIDSKKIQKKYKHAKDFGIEGNFSKSNAKLFEKQIEMHVNSSTEVIKSTYRGQDVYVHLKDGIGVYTDIEGEFISGWKFTQKQINFHLQNGVRIK